MATEPFELVVSPFQVYVAPVGTSFPLVSAAPSTPWVLLAAQEDQDEDGLTVTFEQNIEVFRGQDTAVLKAWRTEEDVTIAFNVASYLIENVAKALNDVTVTDVAAGTGTPGYRHIPLLRGPDVALVALLVRGQEASPYGAGYNVQYEIPRAYNSANIEITHSKSGVALVRFEFKAVKDPTAGYGRLVMQDAAPA